MFKRFSGDRSCFSRVLRIGLSLLIVAYGLAGFPGSDDLRVPDFLELGASEVGASEVGDRGIEHCGRNYRCEDGTPELKVQTPEACALLGLQFDVDAELCFSRDTSVDPDKENPRACTRANSGEGFVYKLDVGDGNGCVYKTKANDPASERSDRCTDYPDMLFYATQGCQCRIRNDADLNNLA